MEKGFACSKPAALESLHRIIGAGPHGLAMASRLLLGQERMDQIFACQVPEEPISEACSLLRVACLPRQEAMEDVIPPIESYVRRPGISHFGQGLTCAPAP